jgi:hypothetical protein
VAHPLREAAKRHNDALYRGAMERLRQHCELTFVPGNPTQGDFTYTTSTAGSTGDYNITLPVYGATWKTVNPPLGGLVTTSGI